MPQASIIGLGRSGIAAAKVLKQQGWDVIISDRATSDSLVSLQKQLHREGITVKLGDSLDESRLNSLGLLVVSPGVPWDVPILQQARSQGIDIIGEMELAWRNLKAFPWVGITGTNGKTTTTALIAAIFQAAGLNAPACGNIGHAACELVLKNDKFDWIIAEISSYQIESSAELAPQIGIWTTFTPDHLQRHHTLENYYNIKASLLTRSHDQIFNGDDPYLRNIGLSQWPQAVWTSVQGRDRLLGNPQLGVYLDADDQIVAFEEKIVNANLLKMVGSHNRQNLLLAVAAARLAGIDKNAIAHALETFPGVPHRLERICTYKDVDFINDSKATNYDAAQVGLNAVKAPVILIAGGEAKAGDDSAWIATIHEKAAKVLLIGEAAAQFAQRLTESGYQELEIVETLENAVTRSRQLISSLDVAVVLLSPACASFDQYRSFEHRGDRFRELCLG